MFPIKLALYDKHSVHLNASPRVCELKFVTLKPKQPKMTPAFCFHAIINKLSLMCKIMELLLKGGTVPPVTVWQRIQHFFFFKT